MIFSSLVFIFKFLPITLLIYYLSPKSLRNFVLLLASLVFYGWGEPVYISIMIFSTVFDYFNGLLIHKYREHKAIPKLVLINSMVVNLGILFFFKYYNFMVLNINNLLGVSISTSPLPLPVGISFYTFQTMSYVIDIYLKTAPIQKNIISFGAYVAMFPQLVAGPIVKYGDIHKQLNERKESLQKFGEGTEIFIIGLCKKVLLANNIGLLWTNVKGTSFTELSTISAWLGIIAFTFQIYFDFSGYSDMAIGLGKMLGFDLDINFNYPYISKSITEFWRRWHISLGSWFREYVYIPLGGNRLGKYKHLRNLFLVWFLTGFWHGASWNFVLWGLYFGTILVLEKYFILKWLQSKPKFISHIYAILLIIIGWVIFDFDKLANISSFLSIMFGVRVPFFDYKSLYYLYTNGLLIICLIIFSTPLQKKIMNKIKESSLKHVLVPIIYVALLFICTAYLVNESYNPFLYFRF
ncbi:MBOAT family protein [Clostridium malenominatum]|uniref:MBOAT family protein n=1 Tax=Clostridium malenominatum TaxID=1539 RepID=A0ABP3UDW1_9CLOT